MLSKISALLSASGSAFCFYAYYERYFRWRECFNELGRCFDSETGLVYLEQAGIAWITLATVFLILAILLFLKAVPDKTK